MIVKSSRTVITVLSLVAILCTGCGAPIVRPHTPSDPKGDESVTSKDESYALIVEELQHRIFHIAPEVYYFRYEEPGLMKDKGLFYGLNLGLTFRNWLPESPELTARAMDMSMYKWMFRAEGRFAYGQVDYDGAYWDGTPLKVDDIDDYVLEGRLLIGPDFPRGMSLYTLFTGIGYRYLNDDTSFHPAGYERESNYLYLPVGFEMIAQLNDAWFWGLSAEFDVFLWGEQNSHLSDVGLIDVDNRQHSGYGLRGAVQLQKKGDKMDFMIEPFIRYWDIGRSDIDFLTGVYEPANNTIEAGIRLILAF